MKKSILALAAAPLLLAGCHGGYMNKPVTEGASWNRKVEALSVGRAQGEEGRRQVTAFFSVQADDVTEPLDLSTQADLLAGDRVLDTLRFQILAQPAGSTAFGCNCPPPLLCWVIDGVPSGCGEAPLVCDPFSAQDLTPDATLSVRLSPSGDGIRDTVVSDDRAGVRYQGKALLAVTGGTQSAVERLRTEP